MPLSCLNFSSEHRLLFFFNEYCEVWLLRYFDNHYVCEGFLGRSHLAFCFDVYMKYIRFDYYWCICLDFILLVLCSWSKSRLHWTSWCDFFCCFTHTRCGSFRPMNERNYLDLETTRTPFSFFENRDRRQRFVTHKIDGVSGRGEIALCTLQLPI